MTRRSNSKYAGLDKSLNLKIRHELLDFDYLHLLSDEEKRWLSDFTREWASADFNHAGKKINRTKKSRKRIYDANNARNRDAFAITKSNGMLKSMRGVGFSVKDTDNAKESRELSMSGSKSTVPTSVEDALIAVIDAFNEKKI